MEELAADHAAFSKAPPELRDAAPDKRKRALKIVLDVMRLGLAVTTDALNAANIEEVANASRQNLREPWSLANRNGKDRLRL